MAEKYYRFSPNAYVMNNPLKFTDPTGIFSTHTDGEGNVLAIYDDGDPGVYRHATDKTKKRCRGTISLYTWNIRWRRADGRHMDTFWFC